jgi:uncharacterized protein YijF (DUF1287 family)
MSIKFGVIILIVMFISVAGIIYGNIRNHKDLSYIPQVNNLSSAGIVLTTQSVTYDPTYVKLDYPNGDVPADRGVCTDVIIRAYRMIGVDLQKEVHEDMVDNFNKYPQLWGLKAPNYSIDHRRVPNLMTFFSRKGKLLPISNLSHDYKPEDIVCWNLGGATHIGLVVDSMNSDKSRYLISHNIGNGQVLEDMLFKYTIIGHYKYNK